MTKRTASENVAEQIRARIATGLLRPGDMLPSETVLLDEFGVARPTMREALRILESDGLVEVRRGVNGGAMVKEPDIATLARRSGLYLQTRSVHMADLMAALRIIQPGAVALAATAARPAQIRAMRLQVETVRATTQGDVERFTDAATEFLNLLMQASGNETIAFLSNLISHLVRSEARLYAAENVIGDDREFREWCVEQYERLVDHIEAGEADKAEALWNRHLHVVPPLAADTTTLSVYRT